MSDINNTGKEKYTCRKQNRSIYHKASQSVPAYGLLGYDTMQFGTQVQGLSESLMYVTLHIWGQIFKNYNINFPALPEITSVDNKFSNIRWFQSTCLQHIWEQILEHYMQIFFHFQRSCPLTTNFPAQNSFNFASIHHFSPFSCSWNKLLHMISEQPIGNNSKGANDLTTSVVFVVVIVTVIITVR